MQPTRKARIGMVSYINIGPIYEVWKDSVHRDDWEVIEAPPSRLNIMLAAGQLDLGFVSSYEYCQRPDQYRILSDLSISATGQVGSVFLFSQRPLEELDGQQVLLTNQSDTSVALSKIILEEFYKVRPIYCIGDVFNECFTKPATLAIGDEALRLISAETFAHCYDLGEVWKKHTGLPFVFAVFAVREDFCREYPEMLHLIHSELVRCKVEGKRDMRAICCRLAPKIPMTVEDCYRYLQGIEYDLTAEKQMGLAQFVEFLVKRADANPRALPLKIHNL